MLPPLSASHLQLTLSPLLAPHTCNAAAHAVDPPSSGFPAAPAVRTSSLLPRRPSSLLRLTPRPHLNPPSPCPHTYWPAAKLAPRRPRPQELGPPPARRGPAGRGKALALPAAVLPRAQHGARGVVGPTMRAYVYGRAVDG